MKTFLFLLKELEQYQEWEEIELISLKNKISEIEKK